MSRHSMSIALVALVIGLIAAAVTSAPEPRQDDVTELRSQVAELSLRVQRLEEATDSYYPEEAAGEAPTSTPARRTMVVDGIELAGGETRDHSAEIRQMRRELQSLEQAISQQRRSLTNLEGRRGSRRQDRQLEAQISAQRRLVNQYQRELTRRQREVSQLEQNLSAPGQIIVGHDGETLIFLLTEADISRELADIAVGDTVSWRGRRVEMEQSSETWIVERIRKVS
jgi:predicted RNase H-like nuclease (RuvC/YqgF family)